MKKDKKVVQKNKKKKDWNKIFLIILLALLILEIILIPCLVYAEVKKVLPIVFFLIIPTVFAIIILILSRNCSTDFEKKRKKVIPKI